MKPPPAWPPAMKWAAVAITIGATSGAMAIAFYGLVGWCTRWLLGTLGGYHPATIAASPGGFHAASGFSRPWAIPLVVAVAAMIAAVLVFRVAPETKGHGTDAAILAINTKPTGMRLVAMPVKMISAAITIGAGGSGGSEGPTAQMAATTASALARIFGLEYKDARVAVTAGLAAGVGAIFRAPVGGALLGVELLFRKDRDWRMLIPSLVTSVIAYLEFAAVYGFTPMFGHVGGMTLTSAAQLVIFVPLGIVCGVLALVYTKGFYAVERIFEAWRTWRPLRVAAGGLAAGLLGLAAPVVLGPGYGTIQQVLSPQRVLHLSLVLLLVMPLAKIAGTSLSIGSGGSGGVFGPGMVVGATAGAALWRLTEMAGWHAITPSSPALLVAAGMAACLGASARAPLAITLIAAETCASWWTLVVAVIAVPLAVAFMGQDTLYREQPLNRAALAAALAAASSAASPASPEPESDDAPGKERSDHDVIAT